MSLYSSSWKRPALSGPQGTKQSPFRIYAEVRPSLGFGARTEMIRDLEKLAQNVEEDLLASGFVLAVPVAWTPQFQAVPARLTIIGFVANTKDNDPPITPSATIIHSGTLPGEKTGVQTPPQGDLAKGDAPLAVIDTAVAELKNAIEVSVAAGSAVNMTIFYIELSGVKYGSLPNKKAFRSFSVL